MSQIASQQNPRLKAVRRLHTKRERARTRPVRGRGRGSAGGRGEGRAARPRGLSPSRVRSRRRGLPRCAGGRAGEHLHARVRGARVIAVYEQRWGDAVGPLCVYLHGVKDPGNVGTVMRSAVAFGASSVALGPGCADPHGPKAVRASMGAIFEVPLARVAGDRRTAGREARAGGPGGRAPERARRRRKAAMTLLIGSERDGLPAELVAALRAGRAHPDRLRVAERGDGRDGGSLRDDPPTI